MKVTIGAVRHRIPHIIHGVSANTMFYLINFDEMFKDKAFDDSEYFDNSTNMSTPYDKDDFGRIMNAYNVFGWTAKDIERAKKTAKDLKVGKKIEAFLDDFMVLRSLFEDAEYDDFDLALDNINYNAENQKDSGEFTIDTSKLEI